MRTERFSRRRLLQRLGTTAALAPFVPRLEQEAVAAEVPRRLVILYNVTGVYGPDWMPQGPETGFRLPSSTAPLERHRDDLIFFKGLHIKEDSADDPHPCQPTVLTNLVRPSGSGTSIDQMVVAAIGAKTRVPYLHLGFKHKTARPQYNLWWNKGAPLPTENSPYAAFSRMFRGLETGGGDAAMLRRLSLRRSVLDHVKGEVQRVSGKISAADRVSMEAHLESLRAVERSLTAPVQTGCVPPAPAKAGVDPGSDASLPVCAKANLDIIAASLACDQTRVAGFAVRNQGGKQLYSWLGDVYAKIEHHAISHGTGAPRNAIARIDRWNTEQVAYFLDQLKARREGGGTLLDNTLVLWCNEYGAWTGSQHYRRDIPFVIAGGKWAFKTGRFKNVGDESHGRLLTAVVRAFDPGAAHVGSTRFGSGPLAL